MSQQKPEMKQIKLHDKKEARKLRSILFDTTSTLTFTPIQVLFFSLGFIFIVFMLHGLVKIFPSTSPIQMFIAVIVLCGSVGLSAYLNKK